MPTEGLPSHFITVLRLDSQCYLPTDQLSTHFNENKLTFQKFKKETMRDGDSVVNMDVK